MQFKRVGWAVCTMPETCPERHRGDPPVGSVVLRLKHLGWNAVGEVNDPLVWISWQGKASVFPLDMLADPTPEQLAKAQLDTQLDGL